MRATFERVLTETSNCTQYLWRVAPDSHADTHATHVITSSVRFGFVRETIAFWADKDGEIIDKVPLSRTELGEHVASLQIAGFEVGHGRTA